MKKLWSILLPDERRRVLGMLVLVMMMACLEMLGVVSIMPFLSVLGKPEVIEESPVLFNAYEYFGFDSSRQFTIALGFSSIALVVVSSFFKTITQHLLNRFVHFQRHSLSARIFSHYLNQPYEFFIERRASDISKNVLSEIDQLMFDMVQPVANLIAQGAVVLAMGLLVFLYDPFMAASIILTLGLLYGGIYRIFRNRLARIGSERRCANSERYQACTEALGGIKQIKVTRSSAVYEEKFNKASRVFSQSSAKIETLSQSPLYVVETIGYTGLIVVSLVLLLRSNDIGQILPALGLYGFAAYRMLPAAQIMYRGFARLKFSSASFESIYEDMMLPNSVEPNPLKSLCVSKEIRLEGVTYAYPALRRKPIIDDISLVIQANTTVAITGRSGAGKSTLMDVLLGLLSPQKGELIVDGIMISSENVASWQKSIGYVPQHIYLFEGTVAENIAFGVSPDMIDRAAIERSARLAKIDEFIACDLVDGYETRVGGGGIRLSGGQVQRIGIARALYSNPAVLLLDEVTSSLDRATEREIIDTLCELSVHKTIILISHRKESLRCCDKIIKLQ